MEQKYIDDTDALLSFIRKSPSCFHVVENVRETLSDAGFEELDETERFAVKPGHSYYVVRGGSAIIAFRIPSSCTPSFSLVAAHTDSPTFKVKENPEITGQYTTLNVEGYGGMLMAPWFDRPLSIAGRAFVREEDGSLTTHLVDLDRDLVSIVDLCIHMNRKANDGIAYKIQKDLFPIIAVGSKPALLKRLVAEKLGVQEGQVIDSDLFLYNRMSGSIWGYDDAFFSSPKIDDLQCAFSAVQALVHAKEGRTIQVVSLFDNEEVGSGSRVGALGDFLSVTLDRIGTSLGWDGEEKHCAQARSYLLSADNGHAAHPNYPEVCDATNKPVVNGGVLIKYAANQKYTTNGASGAFLKNLLGKNGIPCQDFQNNSNIPGGSTLGNLANQHYSIPSIDIGAAQLAMHSPYETGGTKDTSYLKECMSVFLER